MENTIKLHTQKKSNASNSSNFLQGTLHHITLGLRHSQEPNYLSNYALISNIISSSIFSTSYALTHSKANISAA
jgi:hypothetical protein